MLSETCGTGPCVGEAPAKVGPKKCEGDQYNHVACPQKRFDTPPVIPSPKPSPAALESQHSYHDQDGAVFRSIRDQLGRALDEEPPTVSRPKPPRGLAQEKQPSKRATEISLPQNLHEDAQHIYRCTSATSSVVSKGHRNDLADTRARRPPTYLQSLQVSQARDGEQHRLSPRGQQALGREELATRDGDLSKRDAFTEVHPPANHGALDAARRCIARQHHQAKHGSYT